MISNRTSSLLPSCKDQNRYPGNGGCRKAGFGDRIHVEVPFTQTTSQPSSLSKQFHLAVEVSRTHGSPHGCRSQEQLCTWSRYQDKFHDTRLPIYYHRYRNRYVTRAGPIMQDFNRQCLAICPKLDRPIFC
jgi:hypothetical protein